MRERLNPTLLVEEETFGLVTELEVRKASRLRYHVSILTLLPAPEGEGEIPTPRGLPEQLAGIIGPMIRGTDLICLPTASATLHILLVGADLEHLPEIIRRITEEVQRHLFRINGESRAVALSVGGTCFPTAATTARDLLTQAETLARRARQERARGSTYRLP